MRGPPMQRISNERTIMEIEAIAAARRPSLDTPAWTIEDAECRLDRHRFAGLSYAFSIDVLDLRCVRRSRLIWHLMVVTELWHEEGADRRDLRSSKWLKLLAGKTPDVIAWIRMHRPL